MSCSSPDRHDLHHSQAFVVDFLPPPTPLFRSQLAMSSSRKLLTFPVWTPFLCVPIDPSVESLPTTCIGHSLLPTELCCRCLCLWSGSQPVPVPDTEAQICLKLTAAKWERRSFSFPCSHYCVEEDLKQCCYGSVLYQILRNCPFAFNIHVLRLPWWLSGKESARQCRRPRVDPWFREIPLQKEMATHSSILPGKSHGQRSLEGYSPWGHRRILSRQNDLTTAT